LALQQRTGQRLLQVLCGALAPGSLAHLVLVAVKHIQLRDKRRRRSQDPGHRDVALGVMIISIIGRIAAIRA
jgi:hypothetical protein